MSERLAIYYDEEDREVDRKHYRFKSLSLEMEVLRKMFFQHRFDGYFTIVVDGEIIKTIQTPEW